MNAPKRNDPEIISKVAAHFVPKIVQWLGSDVDENTPKEVQFDLEKIFEWDHNGDGYKLAKALEDKYWDVDSEMVGILDDVSHQFYIEHQKARIQWVTANNIPAPVLESLVKWKKTCLGWIPKEAQGIGRVVRNDPDGRSRVVFGENSNTAFIVPWEELEFVPSETASCDF
jgi:hypothetical protein